MGVEIERALNDLIPLVYIAAIVMVGVGLIGMGGAGYVGMGPMGRTPGRVSPPCRVCGITTST